MNITYERSEDTTDEWYTPRGIIKALGPFDLDPCSPRVRLFDTARRYYTKDDDGLLQDWFGRVWLNPPYSEPMLTRFVTKLADHGDGVALLFNRLDTKLFHDVIFPRADSLFFLRDRVYFYRADGTNIGRPGCGSVLIAFGENNTAAVAASGLVGRMCKILK